MDDKHKKRLYHMVGQNIKRVRKQRGKGSSQAWLADQLDVSRTSIVHIEAGRQHPPLHLLWEIAEKLEVPVELLLPDPEEYNEHDEAIKLDANMIAQIEAATVDDPLDRHFVKKFVSSKSKPL